MKKKKKNQEKYAHIISAKHKHILLCIIYDEYVTTTAKTENLIVRKPYRHHRIIIIGHRRRHIHLSRAFLYRDQYACHAEWHSWMAGWLAEWLATGTQFSHQKVRTTEPPSYPLPGRRRMQTKGPLSVRSAAGHFYCENVQKLKNQ